MELILDTPSVRRFYGLLKTIPSNVKEISAAVAFSQSDILIKTCIDRKINLEWWGLFNSGISTNINLIKEALNSTYITFYPFADNFHSKIIHFHDYGIYIGSHNLTEKALLQNVECGVFIKEEELDDIQLGKIKEFFDYLRKNSVNFIRQDLLKLNDYQSKIETLNNERNNYEKEIKNIFMDCFSNLKTLKPLRGITKADTLMEIDENKLNFCQEWRSVHKYLDQIYSKLEAHKLQSWIKSDASRVIVLDQMMYNYYFTFCPGKKTDFEAMKQSYLKNRNQHDDAIKELLDLWDQVEFNEEIDVRINKWSFENFNIVQKLKSQDLTEEEFITLFSHNNVVQTGAWSFENEKLGYSKDSHLDLDKKLPLICKYLYSSKSKQGIGIQDVLRYLFFYDEVSIEDRIYDVLNNPKYKIDYLGKGIIGELLGWGRPDLSYLRNESTNRALYCLGFDVPLIE